LVEIERALWSTRFSSRFAKNICYNVSQGWHEFAALTRLMGHSTIEMTRRYVQMLDDDLLDAHRTHGPIDNFLGR
ncbi:MAG TPA: hypothetical protein DCX54_11545, partial [Flavobacteriales bacterium]|nr:hypothetical protein [Flavobacteriales bacterium]